MTPEVLSLYQWEVQEEKTVDSNQEKSLGDQVFDCLFTGLATNDVTQTAWSMARISYLIHAHADQSESQKNASLKLYPILSPKEVIYDSIIDLARDWLEGDVYHTPISFSSGTLAQRIFLQIDPSGQSYCQLPIADELHYDENEVFYRSFLGLFGINIAHLGGQSNHEFEFTHTKLAVEMDGHRLDRISIKSRS